jgi:hypothetical protein
MANLQFLQSVQGLQTFPIFTAPSAGVYFVNGQLTLPMQTGSGQSQVVATVKQNGSTIYTGIAGATGFQINQIVCAAADAISVVLSSAAAADQVSQAVKGVIGAGNTF